MSILDTFYILFQTNAEQSKKAIEAATEAGTALEEKLNSSGDAAAAAAQDIVDSNSAIVDSFEDVQDAISATSDTLADVPGQGSGAASSVDQITKSTNEATKSTEAMGVASAHAGDAGVEASEKHEEAVGRLGHAIDHVRESATEMAEHLIEQAFEVYGAFKALFALENLVDNFFEQSERSDKLGDKAKAMGVDVAELDAWGEAVRRVGGTADGFESSLRSLNDNLERIALTGHSRALPFFQQLGISIKNANGHVKTAFDILPQLADKFATMDKAKSGSFGRSIGLDEGTILLLQSGRKEVDELIKRQKELGSITKEDTEVAEKFNNSWLDLKQLFRNITVAADTEFLPMLGNIVRGVTDIIEYLREHMDFVKGFFIAIAGGAVLAIGPMTVLSGLFAFITSPITLTIAAVLALAAAFALVYDDVMNFLDGNESVIGELAARWPIIGDIIRGLASIITDFGQTTVWTFDKVWTAVVAIVRFAAQVIGALLNFIADAIDNPEAAFLNLWEAIKRIIAEVIAAFPSLTTAFEDVEKAFDAIGDRIIKLWNDIKSSVTGAIDAVVNAAKSVGDTLNGAWNVIRHPIDSMGDHGGRVPGLAAGQTALGNASGAAPLMSTPAGSVGGPRAQGNVSVTTGDINVNANGVSDPAAVAKAIPEALQRHYQDQIDTHYTDGLAY